MKLDIKKTIKELKDGYYTGWTEGYINDLYDPNEPKEDQLDIHEVENIITDFLECRRIEKENK